MTTSAARAPRSATLPVASAAWALLALGSALACGCSSSSGGASCAAEGTLTVQVTDEDVDDPSNFLCGVAVTLSNGTKLAAQGRDGSAAGCAYTASVAPGSYTVSASASGYTPASESLDITQVNCVTESVQVRLQLYESQETSPEAGLPDVSVIRTPDGGSPKADGG